MKTNKTKTKFQVFNVVYQTHDDDEAIVTLYAKDRIEVRRILSAYQIVSIERV